MHLEFFLEEASMEALLGIILPRMLGTDVTFRLHNMGGKANMLKKLPDRLRGLSWIPDNYKIIILIDEDRQDCRFLKGMIEDCVENAGLTCLSRVQDRSAFQCAVRVCVEEMESWLFGDCHALRIAYPGVPLTLESKARFRDPDHIVGGTWEALERVLDRAGHYQTGMPKVEVARSVAEHMNIAANRSKSFQVFRDLILSL